jgi:hypothetical protein
MEDPKEKPMVKMIIARALVLSFVIVALLTFLFRASGSRVLTYPLFPGLFINMLIADTHGGTRLGDEMAMAVGVVVNTLLYAALCGGLLAASRRARPR